MSHADGEIYKDGKIVAWFEYNGGSDVCGERLYLDHAALKAAWRGDALLPVQPECHHAGEDVLIYSDYGGGFHWKGKACLQCMKLIGPRVPYADDVKIIDGRPAPATAPK